MQFFEVVQTRRSVRVFGATPIERDKIERILATARLAPSAGGLQAERLGRIGERNVFRPRALADARNHIARQSSEHDGFTVQDNRHAR